MPSLMGSALILYVAREALLLVLVLSAPALLASLAVGLLTSVLQAATQIHDSSISFVPKLVVVVLVLAATGPVLGSQVVRFTQSLLAVIAQIH